MEKEYDTNAVASFWAIDDVASYIEHVDDNSTKAQVRAAFDVRDSLAALFLGDRPFFPLPHGDAEAMAHRGHVDSMCRWVFLGRRFYSGKLAHPVFFILPGGSWPKVPYSVETLTSTGPTKCARPHSSTRSWAGPSPRAPSAR